MTITSTKNPVVPRVKALLKKNAKRREEGVFVAEGKRLVVDIVRNGNIPIEVYATGEYIKEHGLPDFSQGFGEGEKKTALPEIIEVTDSVLCAMTDTKTPQGIVAVFPIPEFSAEDLVKRENPFIMILDGVADPGNMGTIFRSFEAAGGDGLILLPGCADPFSGKCIRSTMGSAVRLPHIHIPDAASAKDLLFKSHADFKIFAADMGGRDYTDFDYTGPVAFIIGNEANGISREVMDIATDIVCIPMAGRVESLNAAVSASILAFNAAANKTKQVGKR